MSARGAVPTRDRRSSELPIDQLIAFLRAAHKADAEQFASFARAVDDLPKVPTDTPSLVAHVIAAKARECVRQLRFAHVSALPALRCAILMLSDVLAMEREADAREHPEKYAPFWNRD